jgi:superfamily II DNA or RNA helicase
MVNKTSNHETWQSLKLWPHQEKAVTMVRGYLESSSTGSALVSMPTGTGKSGVIAVLTRCFDDVKVALVLAPWRALRTQLADDIRRRFWKEVLRIDPENWPRDVVELLPSNADHEISKSRRKGVVFVSTIQAIQNLYSAKRPVYDKLKRKLKLVVVDEGHREPALEWAKAVRGFEKPTVLFTATPYRNDFKLFDVDPKYVCAYSYREAVDDKYIRDVKFEERPFGNSTTSFVQTLVDYYDGAFQKDKPKLDGEPRVIVRCENNDEVNDIAAQLRDRGKTVIAIHERFTGERKSFHRRSVPKNPRQRKETFWVHQFKLIEGIDDPRFSLLAIYQPLRNARALVQQVGRIVRNPDKELDQFAHVLCRPNDRQRSFWNGYRTYDLRYEENRRDAQITRRGLFDDIVKLHPEYHYVQGNFRYRFDANAQNIYLDFRYPRSTTMYETTRNFSVVLFDDALRKEWAERDLDVRHVDKIDNDTFVYVYVTYANSPLLLNSYLMQYRLGFTILHLIGKYLFFYDSEGNTWTDLTKGLTRVRPDRLERLFASDTLRVSTLTLMNTDLGPQSVRRRTVSARSLADTAPGLADHAHFCSTVVGYTITDKSEIVRRYLGLSRARITESSLFPLDYNLYIEWINSIVKLLDDKDRTPVSLFERFAKFTDKPPDPRPVNILFDLDDVENAFETSETLPSITAPSVNGDGAAAAADNSPQTDQTGRSLLVLDEVCYGVSKNRRGKGEGFFCRANGDRYQVTIKYDRLKKGYMLASPSLERAYVSRDDGGPRENLVGYLNRAQSFRVITRSPGFIYAHGHFYQPKLALWGTPKDRFDLLAVFKSISELSTMKTEKGSCCRSDGSGWEEGSIFNLIATGGKGTDLHKQLQSMDILVCDDLGDAEVADFIAADTINGRVVFIHCKAVPTEVKRSATKLQDVCQQAIKNLDLLQPFSDTSPPNLHLWKNGWHLKDVGVVTKRIIRPTSNIEGQALWDRIRQIIRDPSSSREVWIVMGQMFSLSEFELQRLKSKPPPEIVQILYLIQSTWGAVSSVGATLRIYCSD